ncbi:uncharacterized protein [Drosophila bipectinata]|uniref:uncharacterized protein n=1 Tax=Drosophila bipectinata TaxID=42026 RepID=UPI001C897666|nr:uncharacterized protein LOC122321290 [Drosophila bipectinata]
MMIGSLPTLAVGLCLLLHSSHSCKLSWFFEPISMLGYSSDESRLNITGWIDRVKRGEFAFSAIIDFKYEMDNTTMIEGIAHRSASGDESDYKKLPLNIPKQPYTDFMNTHYKELVVPNLGYCSNIVQFEDKFQPPWPQRVYTFNKCVSRCVGFPELFPEGFYRLVMNFSSPVDWGFKVVIKIINKLY